MKQSQPFWKSPVGFVAVTAVVIIAITAAVVEWTRRSRLSQLPSVSQTLTRVEHNINLYRLRLNQTSEIEWVSTPVILQADNSSSAILAAAFNHLLAEPESGQLYSEIPPGTQLLSLTTEPEAVYIDLSTEFTRGGGSASMVGRLGQIIYTATSLNSQAQVWISVAGQPLEVLGGEGLEILQPTTRQTFEVEILGQLEQPSF